jgi:hypothetical protein
MSEKWTLVLFIMISLTAPCMAVEPSAIQASGKAAPVFPAVCSGTLPRLSRQIE